MNKPNQLLILFALIVSTASKSHAQKINFIEYDLPNGLHVILHQDKRVPVVGVYVTYKVGSKNEQPGRTGFAHFFEHLMFEGTENIKRSGFLPMVSAKGGQTGGATTQDLTFYNQIHPSNNLEFALWMESERMMHAVISNDAVKAQAEIVKEEKRMRIDNAAYGNATNATLAKLFNKHPYRNPVIGVMKDIDAAKPDEFKAFYKQYYVPNNAVLSIAGNIDVPKAKQLIAAYFGNIRRGPKNTYTKIIEAPITQQLIDTAYDANIQLPGIVAAYRTPEVNSREAKVFEMIAAILSEGPSSRLRKALLNDKKSSVSMITGLFSLEDYGAYMIGALPNRAITLEQLLADINQEFKTLQTELIAEKEYQKVKNQLELAFISNKSRTLYVAQNLSTGYLLHNKNTNYVNEELNLIRSIKREEIRQTARKYLNPQQQLILYYLPGKKNNPSN